MTWVSEVTWVSEAMVRVLQKTKSCENRLVGGPRIEAADKSVRCAVLALSRSTARDFAEAWLVCKPLHLTLFQAGELGGTPLLCH